MFNASEVARVLWEKMGLAGMQNLILCRDAVERAMQFKHLEPEQAANFIAVRWTMYQTLKSQGSIKFASGPKSWLENGKYLETDNDWRGIRGQQKGCCSRHPNSGVTDRGYCNGCVYGED